MGTWSWSLVHSQVDRVSLAAFLNGLSGHRVFQVEMAHVEHSSSGMFTYELHSGLIKKNRSYGLLQMKMASSFDLVLTQKAAQLQMDMLVLTLIPNVVKSFHASILVKAGPTAPRAAFRRCPNVFGLQALDPLPQDLTSRDGRQIAVFLCKPDGGNTVVLTYLSQCTIGFGIDF